MLATTAWTITVILTLRYRLLLSVVLSWMIGVVYVHIHDDVYALQLERDLNITTP